MEGEVPSCQEASFLTVLQISGPERHVTNVIHEIRERVSRMVSVTYQLSGAVFDERLL